MSEPEHTSSDWWITEHIRTTPERTESVNRLIEMHKFKRPPNSKTERKFIHQYIQSIKGIKRDNYGNYHVRVGKLPFLWSSHTDTVHEKKGKQTIGFDKTEIGVAAEDTSGSSCLGADDTAGVWLMTEMIKANVPGLYVFHREEESGCKGSKWIAEHGKSLLAGSLFAIALDRKGTDNLITRQRGDRTCSDDWGREFCKLLNANKLLDYKIDPTGIYTDTATYTDLIGECTNLSVGYHGAHSKWERLDVEHIFKLRDTLTSLDFIRGLATLEPVRKPGEKEVYKSYSYSGSNYHSGYGPRRDLTEDEKAFWDEWGYTGGGSDNYTGWPRSESARIHGVHGYYRNGVWVPYTDLKRGNMRGTASGTQVGHGVNGGGANGNGVSKFRNHHPEANEADPEGKGIVVPDMPQLLPPPGKAVTPPEDDEDENEHDTNYERLIVLIKRNPEATLELLSHLIDDSPETIADILDAEGLTEKTFADEILDMYGVVNC